MSKQVEGKAMKQGHQFKILVADIPEGQSVIRRVLGEKFELIGTDDFAEAKLMLRNSLDIKDNNFSLIVCGMHFDDCKMFDLLLYVMEELKLNDLPFLVIQAKRSQIPFDSAGTVAGMFGALQMLDLQDLSDAEADERIGKTVDRLFAAQA